VELVVLIRKGVDVDVRHRIAEKLRHLGNPNAVDLTPAPGSAPGPEFVVHGAVVIVPGNQQAALTRGRSREAHQELDLLTLLERLAVHLQLPGLLRVLHGSRRGWGWLWHLFPRCI